MSRDRGYTRRNSGGEASRNPSCRGREYLSLPHDATPSQLGCRLPFGPRAGASSASLLPSQHTANCFSLASNKILRITSGRVNIYTVLILVNRDFTGYRLF